MKEAIMKLQTYKLFENGEVLVCRNDVLKALEQEPCEDKITEWKKDFKEYVNALSMPRDDYKGIMEYIDELPTTSEPCKDTKTGHWIGHREHCENLGVIPSGLGAYEWCSNCDCGIDVREWHRNNYNFCPNCGAKMKEDVEQ